MFRELGEFQSIPIILITTGCLLISACKDNNRDIDPTSLKTPSKSSSIFDGELKDYPAPKWYHTINYGTNFVAEKKTIEIDAACGIKILPDFGNPIAEGWPLYLSEKITDADRVTQPHDQVIPVRDIQPLRFIIVGFNDKTVQIVLVRAFGGYLYYTYHAVEADLKIQRSPEVDQRLNLAEFTKPFTRSIRKIQYNDTRNFTHHTLGKPDATRHTQAMGLLWDYYFDRNITIEYHTHVFKIIDGVPESIRHPDQNGPIKNPSVFYHEKQ